MRVPVKDMSGAYIHSTTPRKARLLLRDKKAVVDSNNPFTIRLLFSASECRLKDSKPKTNCNTVHVLSELNSYSIKENTMCDEKISLEVEQEEQKHHFTRRTTHLIYGSYGCGKTSMVRDIINQRMSNNENTMLFTTSCAKQSYYKEINSNILRVMDENSFYVTEDNNTPELFAKYLVQFYISREGKLNVDTLIVDDYPLVTINEDYAEYEYFRELSKQCKENNINLIYTKGTASKEKVYSSLSENFERFSDIITVIK